MPGVLVPHTNCSNRSHNGISLVPTHVSSSAVQVSSASIPFFVGAVLSLVLIPQDNLAESFLAYTLALIFGGAFATLFVGGFVLKALQDE